MKIRQSRGNILSTLDNQRIQNLYEIYSIKKDNMFKIIRHDSFSY